MFSLDGRAAVRVGSARVSLATGKPATPQRLGHSPRMCYQHPNGVMSLLKHLAISVRFTMKAALFISDFTGANHIWHPFRQNDRFERALRQFPTSEATATSWTEHINITRQTTDLCNLHPAICCTGFVQSSMFSSLSSTLPSESLFSAKSSNTRTLLWEKYDARPNTKVSQRCVW